MGFRKDLKLQASEQECNQLAAEKKKLDSILELREQLRSEARIAFVEISKLSSEFRGKEEVEGVKEELRDREKEVEGIKEQLARATRELEIVKTQLQQVMEQSLVRATKFSSALNDREN